MNTLETFSLQLTNINEKYEKVISMYKEVGKEIVRKDKEIIRSCLKGWNNSTDKWKETIKNINGNVERKMEYCDSFF